MRHRKQLVIAAVVAGVVLAGSATTAVVAASTKSRGTSTESNIDHQKVAWRVGASNVVATKSKAWRPLPLNDGGCAPGADACGGTTPLLVQSNGDITVTFSGNFTRAPVELRLRDGGRLMRPGPAKFKPSKNGESFSFTFIGLAKSGTCREVELEWRSPTGAETRMQRGIVVVDYKYTKPPKNVGCV